MPKTIWVFHHYADPPDGHWTNHFQLFELMVNKGYRVTIFSSSFSHYSRRDDRLKPGEKFKVQDFNGVRFVFIKTPSYFDNGWRRFLNFLVYAVRVYRISLRDAETPNVIIGSSPHPFCAFAGYIVARRKSIPFFFEVHDLWPQFFVELGAYPQRHPVVKGLRWIEKLLYRKSDMILTLWPRMDLYIRQFDVPMEKIVWMPMGLNLEMIKNLEPTSKSTQKGFTVMYRGRFGLTQEMMVILKAARIIQDKGLQYINFEFVGEGSEREKLVGNARDMGLRNVRYRDFTAKSEMLKDMMRSDVLIGSLPDLPHFKKYGMLSTKLLDYMMAGRPIIFAANAEDHVVTRSRAGIVVPPDNPEAVVEAILQIAQMSPQERKKMGENGARYLRENHDVQVLATRLESLL